MKKLFLLLLFLCSTQIFAQGAFGSGGDLEPLGPYPIVKQKFIQGGLHVLSDTSLLASYLRDSVMVYQKGDSKFYRWESGVWDEVPTGLNSPLVIDLTAGDTLAAFQLPYSPGGKQYITANIPASVFSGFQGLQFGNGSGQGTTFWTPDGMNFIATDGAGGNRGTVTFKGTLATFSTIDNATGSDLTQLVLNDKGIRVNMAFGQPAGFKGIFLEEPYHELDSIRVNKNGLTYLPQSLIAELVEDSLNAYSPSIPNLQQVINVNGNIEFEDELEWVTDEAIVFLSTDFTLSTVLGAGSIATGGVAAKYFVSNGGTDGLDFRTRAYFRNSPYGRFTPPTDSNIVPFSIIKALISDSLGAYPTPTLAQVTASGATTATTVSFSGVTIEGATQLLNTVEFNGNWLDYTETALTDGQTLVSKSGQMTATNVAEIISHTEAINFPSIAAGSFQSTTFTLTGVEVGDVIVMTPDKNAFTDNLQFQAWVNGANTVAVQAYNYTAGAIDPPSNSFYFKIIK